MLTQEQINAETIDPMTDEQVLALSNLVKKYPHYRSELALYPNLGTKLIEEKVTPTVKTKALKAVLTALSALPTIVVESQGSDTSQSFFSTRQNWNELAQDVLDTLYDTTVPYARTMIVVQRKVANLKLDDTSIIDGDAIGRIAT